MDLKTSLKLREELVSVVNNSYNEYLVEKGQFVTNSNVNLPHEAYVAWDNVLVENIKPYLTLFNDLREAGLVNTSIEPGITLHKYQKLNEFSPAMVSMDGLAKTNDDALSFSTAGVPIPYIHKNFTMTEDEILACLHKRVDLPKHKIEAATRVVGEAINTLILEGSTVNVEGYTMPGIKNHTSVHEYTVTNDWGGGSDDPVNDVINMIELLQADQYATVDNSCVLYVTQALYTQLLRDFNPNKGVLTTYQRILEIPYIRAVKVASGLGSGELCLIDMQKNCLELFVRQDPMWYPEIKTRTKLHEYVVIAAMAIAVKTTEANQCGICLATGA
jgi:hypothetical protein